MAYSHADLRKMNEMDPSLVEALKQRPFPIMPQDYFAQREARAAHLRTLRHLMPIPGPIPADVVEKELFVTARDGHQIRVIHYRPAKQSSGPGSLILLFHEGGWGQGDLTDEEFNARMFSKELGAVCLNVEYRLQPENQFPIGIHDAWDVLEWAATNAASIEADPTKGLIVGGSSAGGNIAAVLSHQSRMRNLQPPVTGQWLSVPYLLPLPQIPDKYRSDFLSPSENVSDPVSTSGGYCLRPNRKP